MPRTTLKSPSVTDSVRIDRGIYEELLLICGVSNKKRNRKETLFDRVRNHADNVEIRRWDRMDRTLDTENIKRGGIRIQFQSPRVFFPVDRRRNY